ncbi:MAG: 2-oxoisovalerate dehydrogenase [Nitrospirales bacterium]
MTAQALGDAIFTEADNMPELHTKVREAVKDHFDEGKAQKLICLHHVREEVIAA